jgi:phosphotransferase system HPr (HPr) family protein
MKEREVVIGHQLGLHARAAAQLVQLSAKFRSTIVLVRADDTKPAEADARSILSILLLAARHGSRLQVRADGSDEDEALEKVCEYLSG